MATRLGLVDCSLVDMILWCERIRTSESSLCSYLFVLSVAEYVANWVDCWWVGQVRRW